MIKRMTVNQTTTRLKTSARGSAWVAVIAAGAAMLLMSAATPLAAQTDSAPTTESAADPVATSDAPGRTGGEPDGQPQPDAKPQPDLQAEPGTAANQAKLLEKARTLLVELDDSKYLTRQAALSAMLALPTLSNEQLIDLAEQATGLEQRQALLIIAKHHLCRGLRETHFSQIGSGALGLAHHTAPGTMHPTIRKAGVLVVATIPGFPAHQVLRAGDMIIEIDGQPIPQVMLTDRSGQRFRNVVESHNAGESLKLKVIRDGHAVDVAVVLASVRALERIYEDDHDQFIQEIRVAWKDLFKKLTKGWPKPIPLLIATADEDQPDQTGQPDQPGDVPERATP